MGRKSTRENIVETGLKVMFQSGYVGTSVRDIVAAAGVPQGSFTNHFRSKEQFTGEVLDRYFDNLKGIIRETLGDAAVSPRERLRRYLDFITSRLGDEHWTRGMSSAT
ncbi:MAG: TetR/AcrR family transcriptional regulator [Paludibaculum sp.]